MPFDPRDLAMILGSLGSIRGSPAGNAFAQTWQQLEQQKRQRELQDQELAAREADRQFQRENITADNRRADQQLSDAQTGRRLQFIQSLPTLFSEDIADPAEFDQRFGVAASMGRELGIEPGFLQTFRPQPSVFEQRKARKLVKQIESQKRFAHLLADPDFDATIFPDEKGENPRPLGEWRRLAGLSPAPGSPPLPGKPGGADDPLDRQYLTAAIAAFKQANGREPNPNEMMGLITEARKKVGQADDRPRVDPNLPTAAGALPPRTQRLVDAQSKGFDQQPVVKTVQKQAEAVTFANSLDVNTTNPADDQALIYAFAKAMDPDSVVREGEYATVQRYAQSWAEKFGFDVARIFSNTTFLTPQARQNMKDTIAARYRAGRAQYDNVRKSYSQRINRITGQQDGDTHLIDYAGAFPDDVAAEVTTRPKPPGPNPFRR